MDEHKNKSPELNDLIFETMNEVLKSRSNIRKWRETEHMLKDTEVRINQFGILSDDISDIAQRLGEAKKARPDDPQVIADMKMFDIMRSYELEIQGWLNRDFDEKKKADSDNKFDYVKNVAFILSVPGLFVTGVKNGVGNGHIDVNEALVLGFAVSIPTVFHKKTKLLFAKAAKGVCCIPATLIAIPASVTNDIRVVYTREIIKEKTNNAQVCFIAVAKSINDNTQATRAQMKVGLGKLFGRRGPRP